MGIVYSKLLDSHDSENLLLASSHQLVIRSCKQEMDEAKWNFD